MQEIEPEITAEERELLQLFDEELDIPPLPPDFRSTVLTQLDTSPLLPLSEENTEPEITDEERELLRSFDRELDIPSLPRDFRSTVLAQLGSHADLYRHDSPIEIELYNINELLQNGIESLVNGDYTIAVELFRHSAERGDAISQCYLGMMYYAGRGVERSDIEAVAWFRRAAERGDPLAQDTLAWAYLKGRGIEQSHTEALLWLQRATKQEFSKNNKEYIVANKLYYLGQQLKPVHIFVEKKARTLRRA